MNPEIINFNKLYGAFSLIFFFAISWHINKLLNKNLKISVITDSLISRNYDSRLKKLIDLNIYKLNAKEIKQELNQQLYPVSLIEKKSKSNSNKILNIKFEKPEFKIISNLNNYKILTNTGKFVDKDFYCPETQENLPIVYTKKDNLDSQESFQILNFLKNIPSEIIENYFITWHDKTNITLLDKTDNFFYLKAENLTLIDNNLLNKTNKIKEKLKREKNLKKKNNFWCADLRFRDKIVLSFKGEGEHEGKKFIR